MAITTNEEYESALAEVEAIMRLDPDPGTKEAERLDLLAAGVSAYEDIHYPIGKPTLWEAIRFRLEQRGWFESR